MRNSKSQIRNPKRALRLKEGNDGNKTRFAHCFFGALNSFRISCFVLSAFLLGCHTDMRDQPRYETYEASDFFGDGQIARPVVAGTVARGQLREDDAFYRGKEGEAFVAEIPVEIDRSLLLRGQERFNIYCANCHGPSGDGDGMIVRRGFKKPPSYHSERLRNAAAGHYFDVVTNGFGAMPRFAPQIEPGDRWAIIAYLRALQRSQNATLEDVPEDQRSRLEEPKS